MRDSGQCVFLGERERHGNCGEEDAALLISVVELLPVCPPELLSFAGRQHIITPLPEILS